MEEFAYKVKELRIAVGFSQEKLVAQMGIRVKSVQRYESGYRPDRIDESINKVISDRIIVH